MGSICKLHRHKVPMKQLEVLPDVVGYSEVIDVEFTNITKPEKEMKELPKE